MSNTTRRLSLVMASVFTAFTMMSAAVPALGVAKKKVTKKATKKVVHHYTKKVTVKKAAVNPDVANYNKALAAVKVAEGAFQYDMTNPDNIAYVKVKANLAQTAIENVMDSAKQAYLGTRLSVVENKITTVEANYAEAQKEKLASSTAAKAVVSATALNNTTVVVKFSAAQAIASAADFTFDNGLTVTAAAVKQDDNTSIVLTTSAQDSTKTYKLSYQGTDTGLTVTGMAVATTPAAIALTTSNTMGTLGTNVTVTATVTPASAGVPVTFNILCDDSTKATINTPIVKEILTDAKGVASVTYTRYYGAQDDLRVYPTGSPAIGATGNVYWGSNSRLSVKVTSTSASVTNSTAVIYQVTYLDSTGAAEKNKLVNVMLKENMNASGSTANVVNLSTGYVSMNQNLYQRDQISDANALSLQTDSNGVATFQVTGSNTVATPIIYTDEATTGGLVNNNYVAGTEDYTHGNFKATTKLAANFLQITAPTATFTGGNYTISCDQTTGNTVTGVTGTENPNNDDYGTTYTITVKKADGTADANDTVSVGLQEWMTSGTGTTQAIAGVANNGALSVWNNPTWANGSTKVALVTLNSNGQAAINITGQTANLLATPIIWKDFNNNNLVDNGEPAYTAATSLFVAPAANAMTLSGRDTLTNGNSVSTETSALATPLWLRARIVDQSGNMYSPAGTNIVTYTIQNTGSHIATLKAYTAVCNIASWLVNGNATNADYVIPANSTTTVVATTTNGSAAYIQLVGDYVGANGTTLSVQASINDQKDGNYYSVPATVYTFVSPNTLPTGAQTVTYTGTVTGFSTTTGVNTPSRVILKLDGSGDAESLNYYSDDSYALGTDFTNVSYIPVATFAADLSVNDRVQALVTFHADGTYSTAWKLINVDGSSDSSVDVTTEPHTYVPSGSTNNGGTTTTTYITSPTATYDGFMFTAVAGTATSAVKSVKVYVGTVLQATVTPNATTGAFTANAMGVTAGGTVIVRAYDANGTQLGSDVNVTVH